MKAVRVGVRLEYVEPVASRLVFDRSLCISKTGLAKSFGERGFEVVSGGTDTHLFLLDLGGRDLTGKKAERVLEEAGITVNKNAVPFDKKSPFVTSGIRVGTPALTTRGMKNDEMIAIADMMCRVLENIEDNSVIEEVRTQTRDLCEAFPLYAEYRR